MASEPANERERERERVGEKYEREEKRGEQQKQCCFWVGIQKQTVGRVRESL